MEVLKISVFEFKELDEKTQEKIIEDNSQINFFDEWWEFALSNFAEETKEKFGIEITPKEIYFDINNYGNDISANKIGIIDKEKFAEAMELTKRQKKDFLNGDIYFHFGNSTLEFEDCREPEPYDKTLEIEEYEEDGGTGYNADDFGDLTHDFLYGKILKPLLNVLRKEAEYLGSKEAIIETIKCNEMRFLKNGQKTFSLKMEDIHY